MSAGSAGLISSGGGLFQSISEHQSKKRERKRAKKERRRAAQLHEAALRKRTAVRAGQGTEAARLNRLRQASIMTRGFAPPTLGSPGQLG